MSTSPRALSLVWAVFLSAFLSGASGAFARAAIDAIPSDALALATLDYQKDRFTERVIALRPLLVDESMAKTIAEIETLVGFSPLEDEFLKNLSKLAVFLWKGKDPKEPTPCVVIEVADRAKHVARVEKMLANLGDKQKAHFKVTAPAKDAPPPGFTVIEELDGDKTYYVMSDVDNLFVIGLGREGAMEAVKAALATIRGGTALKGAPAYVRMAKDFPLDGLANLYVPKKAVVEAAAQEKWPVPLDFVDALGFRLNYKDGKVAGDLYMGFDPEAKANPFKPLRDAGAGPLTAPRLLPHDTAAYMGFHAVIPKDQINTAATRPALEAINSMLGLDFEKDIFPWLGSEILVAAGEYKLLDAAPYLAPRIYFGVRVKDPKAALQTAEKAEAAWRLRNPGTEFKSGTVGNVSYRLSPATDLKEIKDLALAYGVVSDFLVLTTSPEAMKAVVESAGDVGKNLSVAPRFFGSLGTVGKTSLMTFFLDGERIAPLMVDLVRREDKAPKALREAESIKAIRGISMALTSEAGFMTGRAVVELDTALLKRLAAEPDEDE